MILIYISHCTMTVDEKQAVLQRCMLVTYLFFGIFSV